MVLSDLDGTLVHSSRRCPDVQGAVVVEVYEERAVGFMSPTAWAALAELQSRSVFVPATARTARQYGRIRFPERPRVAIVAAGGVILVDGEPDPAWMQVTRAMVDDTAATVADVVERMRGLEVVEEPRSGDDRFACVKVAAGGDTGSFESWCRNHGWRVVCQDGRVYALPLGMSKAAAIPRVAELVGAPPTMALGDGLMDVEMLGAVEHAISPEDSALWRAGHRITVAVPGVALSATEAVLACALARVAASIAANKA